MNDMTIITLTAQAYWRLQWLCQRSPGEVSAMGLLAAESQGIVIEDFLLIRQEISPAHVDLDMDHWADRQAELFDSRGIEPWRLSVWAHTHPAGLNRPSGVDEATMAESFAGWDLAVMLIMTRDGQFYGRMDIDHDFGGGESQRISVPCAVEIDWSAAGGEAITEKVIASWEEEFAQCVSEISDSWMRFEDEPPDHVSPRRNPWLPKQKSNGIPLGEIAGRKERRKYVETCHNLGYDPDDPENIENYFGFEPIAEY